MHLNLVDRKNSSAQSSSSVTSSLSRAFTTSTRNKTRDDKDIATSSAHMGRPGNHRGALRPSQISLPVALVSTTNMLSYDAPDIIGAPHSRNHHVISPPPNRKASTASSSVSDEDGRSRGDYSSDRSSVRSRTSEQTDATSLSVEGFNGEWPEQNHLTNYFKKTNTQSTIPYCRMSSNSRTDSLMSGGRSPSPVASPQIPSRAPTHSMKAHVLSHKRSVSRGMVSISPRQENPHQSIDTVHSLAMSPESAAAHPFSRQLEQLNEAAEEFSSTVREVEQDADFGILRSKGLGTFCAAEYMQEIAPLFARTYDEDLSTASTWI